MAKYENEGYCPHNSVCEALSAENADKRLIGFWSMIGPSVVFTTDTDGCDPNSIVVNKIFCEDNIAHRLLTTIIKTNANVDKVLVHQIFKGACNTQRYADIQECLMAEEHKGAKLIIEHGSNFAVVMHESSASQIDLYVWDLTACMY